MGAFAVILMHTKLWLFACLGGNNLFLKPQAAKYNWGSLKSDVYTTFHPVSLLKILLGFDSCALMFFNNHHLALFVVNHFLFAISLIPALFGSQFVITRVLGKLCSLFKYIIPLLYNNPWSLPVIPNSANLAYKGVSP